MSANGGILLQEQVHPATESHRYRDAAALIARDIFAN
jgi:hypothetical protein